MITPAGKECSFFFGDYHRGRNHEECRLLLDHKLDWIQDFCQNCPIPGIQQANGCENLVFSPKIYRPLLILKQQIQIDTYCKKSNKRVKVPEIGCGECNPQFEFIMVEDNENDPAD
jgi:hypothetical protein